MQAQTPGRTGPLHHARRLVRRNRRLFAALLLCAAAGLTVQAFVPAPAASVPVVVAAADLPAGTVLTDAQLTEQRYPATTGPPGSAASPAGLVGRRLASALRAGSPVLDTSLVGPGLLTGRPPGTAAVPVRPADPSTVQLVSPGQLVDIVLSSGNGIEQPVSSTVLARSVPVLWKADGGTADPGLLGSTSAEGLVVVAASPAEAAALAGSSSRGQVVLVLVG
ncbi:Flp pilus assembly protein CpaB [Arthrobacter sp. I2-34]|uniref:Flp pilus assembly protein CpaB n=1 Tax=Arthrobacter hankyongi TaxID=2904801 RepID=A0ABS9L4X9_9MICC|nr:Flp pilus assembly protein CpaB [Arthrobacter hankyongi]MCG2621737.1 Flp pilus assembly protein CpaB [Arthrobacter hankyongi]